MNFTEGITKRNNLITKSNFNRCAFGAKRLKTQQKLGFEVWHAFGYSQLSRDNHKLSLCFVLGDEGGHAG